MRTLSCFAALALIGCASSTDHVEASNDALNTTSCTSDDACGGGSAMCFIDRCATIDDSEKAVWSVDRIGAAFDTAGSLQVAYTRRETNGRYVDFPLTAGPWAGAFSEVTTLDMRPWGSGATAAPWRFEPTLSWVDYGGLHFSDAAGMVSTSPVLPPSPQQVAEYAVAENAAGTTFATFLLHDPNHAGTTYTVWFASKPAGGAWSALEKVWDPGSAVDVGLHVRADGGADVLLSDSYLLMRARRSNPIDPWSITNLASASNAGVLTTRGADGTTHAVFASDADAKYMEVGDDGVVRTVPLGRTPPPRSIGADDAGNVWIQVRADGPVFAPSVVRVSPSGAVAQRSLGVLNKGRAASLAVAKTGELALLWTDASSLHVRRVTPR